MALPNSQLLWYGFFGFFGLFASYLGLYWSVQDIRVLRSGQHPAAGVRTYRPMPIRRGSAARVIGCLQVLAITLPLVLLPLTYNVLAEHQAKVSALCSQPSQSAAL